MTDGKDGKTSEDSILLNTDILSEEFDDESDDEPEETQINKQVSEKSPPVQPDPNAISISIKEERPKYETEKKKKEFSSFIGRPRRKIGDIKSESFNERTQKRTRGPEKIRKCGIHTDPVKKRESAGLGDLKTDREKIHSSKIRTADLLQKKEANRKKEKVNFGKKPNSGLSPIEKREAKKLIDRPFSKKENEPYSSKISESLSESKPFITKTREKKSSLVKTDESRKNENWKSDIGIQNPVSEKKKDANRESLTYTPKKKEYSGFESDTMSMERKKKTDDGMKIEMMEKKHG